MQVENHRVREREREIKEERQICRDSERVKKKVREGDRERKRTVIELQHTELLNVRNQLPV